MLTVADYARAQDVASTPTHKQAFTDPKTGTRKMLYIHEPLRYALVVKSDGAGDNIFFTTYYRLHEKEEKRSKEISRLLKNARKTKK